MKFIKIIGGTFFIILIILSNIISLGMSYDGFDEMLPWDNFRIFEHEILFNSSEDEYVIRKSGNITFKFEQDILQYDKLFFQVIPFDYNKAQKLLEEYEKVSLEISEKYEHIKLQKLLSKKTNSSVTVEQVNDEIKEFNSYYENKEKELKLQIPQYNDNNWKEIEIEKDSERKFTYNKDVDKLSYIVVYAKILDHDETIIENMLVRVLDKTPSEMRNEIGNTNKINHNIFNTTTDTVPEQVIVENQSLNTQLVNDKINNQHAVGKNNNVINERTLQNNTIKDNTIAVGSLPNAGSKYIVVMFLVLLAIVIYMYNKMHYLKGI